MQAIPTLFRGRIAGGEVTTDAPHSCILLVFREDLGDGQAALGGGSIVSRNRIVTAAHVIRG